MINKFIDKYGSKDHIFEFADDRFGSKFYICKNCFMTIFGMYRGWDGINVLDVKSLDINFFIETGYSVNVAYMPDLYMNCNEYIIKNIIE